MQDEEGKHSCCPASGGRVGARPLAAAGSPWHGRRVPDRARLAGVIPVLPARDVREAVRFYVERLGFELVFLDSPDDPRYAAVRRDAVELHLQFQFPKDSDAGTAGQAMLRLVVDDPDFLFREYADKGVFGDQTRLNDTRGAPGSSPSGTSTATA